jgi:hypothetical protein
MSAMVKASATSMVTGAVELHGVADVFRLADALSKAAGFVPRQYIGKPEAIAAAMLMGLELGVGPMEALRSIHVIEGKPTMSADMMLGRAIRSGVKPQWLRSDAEVAELRLTRAGYEPHVERFTIDDAKAAGLIGKDNWRKYTRAMLRARCVSAAMRAFCPDVLGSGVYTPEELDGDEPAQSSERPVHREPERPSTIDAQLVELETAVPSRPAPTQLTQTATAEELQAWCDANGGKLRALPGARQGEAIGKVVAHADRIGVGAEDVWRWLELPVAEEEAAQ